jgi:hypothetical protein
MAAHDSPSLARRRARLLLALGIPCFLVGCGGDDGSNKPATVTGEQVTKAQNYMRSYRDEIRSANKEKAAKGGAPAPKQP